MQPATNHERHKLNVHTPASGMANRFACMIAAALLITQLGCGVNLNEILFQSASAAGRTYIDLLLTDFQNDLADRFDQDAGADDDQDDGDADAGDDAAGDAGDDDAGDAGDTDDGGLDTLTGDPAAGEPLYASCAGCHCVDAAGGCLLDAPPIAGVDLETLDDFLRGDATHPAKPDLTDQELVDLQAFLASLSD